MFEHQASRTRICFAHATSRSRDFSVSMTPMACTPEGVGRTPVSVWVPSTPCMSQIQCWLLKTQGCVSFTRHLLLFVHIQTRGRYRSDSAVQQSVSVHQVLTTHSSFVCQQTMHTHRKACIAQQTHSQHVAKRSVYARKQPSCVAESMLLYHSRYLLLPCLQEDKCHTVHTNTALGAQLLVAQNTGWSESQTTTSDCPQSGSQAHKQPCLALHVQACTRVSGRRPTCW